MSYSCTDFVESITEALSVNLPDTVDHGDGDGNLIALGDLALAEIMRLQRIEAVVRRALTAFDKPGHQSRFALAVGAAQCIAAMREALHTNAR